MRETHNDFRDWSFKMIATVDKIISSKELGQLSDLESDLDGMSHR